MKKVILFFFFHSFCVFGFGQCIYTLDLQDSWGNGWYGSSLDVNINGTITNYNFYHNVGDPQGGRWIIPISVNTGDNFSVTYNYGGDINPGNQMWTLYDPEGQVLFTDGTISCYECWESNGIDPPTDGAGWSGIANCSCPIPTGLETNSVLMNSAIVSWDDLSDGSIPNTFNIEITPGGMPQGSGVNFSNVSSPFTFNNLTLNTTYDFYVQGVCEGTPTAWSNPSSFTTENTPLTTPHCTTFDDWDTCIDDCWPICQIENGFINETNDGNNWHPKKNGNDVYSGPSDDFTGDGGYLYSYAGYLSPCFGDDIFAILTTPSYAISTLDNPVLSFQYFMLDHHSISLTVQIENPAGSNNWSDLVSFSGEQQQSYSAPWLESETAITGNIVKFRFISSASTTQGDISIDQICIKNATSCPVVSEISTSLTTGDSAEVNWLAGGTETNWDIEVVLDDELPTGIPTHENVNNPFNISGLVEKTMYKVYVRSDCNSDNTDVSDWRFHRFRTVCNIVPPYLEDFNHGNPFNFYYNNVTNDHYNEKFFCWNTYGGGSLPSGPLYIGNVFINNQQNNMTGSTGLRYRITNDNRIVWVIGSNFDLTNGIWQAEFDLSIRDNDDLLPLSLGNDNELHFIVSTDGGDNYTSLKSWDDNSPLVGGNRIYVDLSAYQGLNNVMLGFYINTGEIYTPTRRQVSIDNFAINPLGSCNDIFCTPPTNISVDNPTQNRMAVSFDYAPNVEKYQVRYREVGTSSWTSKTVPTQNYIHFPTSALKTYQLQVRAFCCGEWTDWSSMYYKKSSDCITPFVTDVIVEGIKVTIHYFGDPDEINTRAAFRVLGSNDPWQEWGHYRIGAPGRIILKENNGILPNTTYEFKLHSTCGSGFNGWSPISTFTTGSALRIIPNGMSNDFLYPNPAKDKIHLELDRQHQGDVNISVFNIYGSLIWNKSFTSDGTDYLNETIDVSKFKSGAYFINIRSDDKNNTLKFLKK